MILSVYLPDSKIGTLTISEGDLVYDGTEFVKPEIAKYVALYDVPVQAVSLEYKNIVDILFVSQQTKAFVQSIDLTPSPTTDPEVIAEPDPNITGICVCFITCRGTWLSYVKVSKEP